MINDGVSKKILLLSWIVLLLAGLIVGLFWTKLPPQIPWFYSLPLGDQQLVNKELLVGVILGNAVVLWLTSKIAKWSGEGDVTVETTLVVGYLVVLALSMASLLKVLQIFAL